VIGKAGTPLGHIALVHEDVERAEAVARALRGAGHRVSVVPPGRRVIQGVLDSGPDLVMASLSISDPDVTALTRSVRQALGSDLPIVVLYKYDIRDAPPETDEILREPADAAELQIRVGRLLETQAEKRVLQRKGQELLGLYKMSWAFSLAGGEEALFGHIARQCAEQLKAERGVVLLYDAERRQMVAQAPGHGLSREQILRLRYFVDGEARSRWNFRKNGPLLSNKARADTRLLSDLVSELEFQSLMVAPMTRGPEFQGLLLVADRAPRAPFTDEDLNLLLAMAAQATVAVENMRLHSELKRANARLQEYDRLKSEFVGIVAHDFRRPLMAIRGFAELVLEEPDLPIETRQEFMRTVVRETDHLATLANDTLLITQIETGQFSYNWSEIDLGPFILDAVPLGLSEHSVLMDIPAGFPKILADAVRLRQVITNLTMNAAKYSPAGGSITVRCRERGADHIVLEVIDHGLGIPPEQVDKLFQKFERVRTNEHLAVSGTGLGLYICRLIVEGHGGQIWVESELGKGSTFGLSLPRDARKLVRPTREEQPAAASAAPSAPTQAPSQENQEEPNRGEPQGS
jgi:signal transduction histidine kinase